MRNKENIKLKKNYKAQFLPSPFTPIQPGHFFQADLVLWDGPLTFLHLAYTYFIQYFLLSSFSNFSPLYLSKPKTLPVSIADRFVK